MNTAVLLVLDQVKAARRKAVDYRPDHERAILDGGDFDTIEIDGASGGIDAVRDIVEAVKFAPASGPQKVLIITSVEALSDGAMNALQKTIEEMPEHLRVILATDNAAKVPERIRKHCLLRAAG